MSGPTIPSAVTRQGGDEVEDEAPRTVSTNARRVGLLPEIRERDHQGGLMSAHGRRQGLQQVQGREGAE